jgi:hypothetical protein
MTSQALQAQRAWRRHSRNATSTGRAALAGSSLGVDISDIFDISAGDHQSVGRHLSRGARGSSMEWGPAD